MREPALPRKGPVGRTGRLMLWCPECGRRNEDRTGAWRCPEHPQKTVVQKNRPYFGTEIPTLVEGTKAEGLKIVDPAEALRGKA